MNATDEQNERLGKGYPYTLRPELHKALKASGVDYWVAQGLTFWNRPDGREFVAYGYQSNGKPRLAVKISGITDPEQAIAVALGAETCHNVSKVMDEYGQARFVCSECSAWIDLRMLWNPEYRNGESPWVRDCNLNFCPNCGRRIVEVDE